jgi:type VI secretion system protein ImpH
MATPGGGTSSGMNEPSKGEKEAPSAQAPAAAPPSPVISAPGPPSVAQLLFREGFSFDFFQAIRLLEHIQPDKSPLTRTSSPAKEIVRLKARLSFDFPPSPIYEVLPATADAPIPAMIVAFMGLTGPSGVLPRVYTELLYRIQRDMKHPEKFALRDWFDLYNHRMISLFARAWEKYRFYIPYERGEARHADPDQFTQTLFSLIGMGQSCLRNRLHVAHQPAAGEEKILARIDDLALLRFGGFFAPRPRCAVSLQVLLSEYFKVQVQVLQFQGQWLRLEPTSQSCLGARGVNNGMGVNAMIGDRIWDVSSKIRVRIGPLSYDRFLQFLPDRSPVPQRKLLYLLSHLIRLYIGMEIDVEVQVVLKAREVPMCKVGSGAGPIGSRIGWNCWSRKKEMKRDADEPVFEAEEITRVEPA